MVYIDIADKISNYYFYKCPRHIGHNDSAWPLTYNMAWLASFGLYDTIGLMTDIRLQRKKKYAR